MYVHPPIFNYNAMMTSAVLGISRSTLLGWVSTNVKKNVVGKWYDIVKALNWAKVKKHFSPEIVRKSVS